MKKTHLIHPAPRRPRNGLSLLLGAALLVAPLALAACGGGGGGGGGTARSGRAVTMKGSDTMVILGQRWAEVYMQTHPGKAVQVTGGGSGTGIAALINGTTTICQASRPMKDTEKKQLEEKSGAPVEEHPVAMDGITVYVHEGNPITQLTKAQLKGIYTGQVTNWREIGGGDAPIVVYGRENSSGTYVFFKEHVLENSDFAPNVQTLPGTSAVADAVGKDPNGIGYGGYAYGGSVKHVPVAADANSPAVAPNEANVRDGSYPLARNLYWYTRANPPAEAKALLEWVLSDAGQAVVKEVGYFPLH